MSDHVFALSELEEFTPAWFTARHRFATDDPEGYRQWLDDEELWRVIFDKQVDWICANFGLDAASNADYEWASEYPDYSETKVYGHGVLHTQGRWEGRAVAVMHKFLPFGVDERVVTAGT